jgi:hypothetical protein
MSLPILQHRNVKFVVAFLVLSGLGMTLYNYSEEVMDIPSKLRQYRIQEEVVVYSMKPEKHTEYDVSKLVNGPPTASLYGEY